VIRIAKEKEDRFKELNDKLQQIQEVVDGFYNNLDEITTDNQYDELIKSFSDFDYSDKKLFKKQKEEKKQKVIELMKNKFPNFVKSFTELDIILDGIEYLIVDKKERLESIQEQLDEIESLQEEIEDKKQDIDF